MGLDDIDKKIEEFFFNPAKTLDEYGLTYKSNNPNEEAVRFSPLYLASRDIYYCFGKNPEISKKIETGSMFGPTKFIGFVLTYQTLDMVARAIGLKPKDYLQKFFDFSTTEAVDLSELRHAITHEWYSLFGFRQKDKKNIWFDISDFSDKIIIPKKVSDSDREAHYVVNPTSFYKNFFESLEKVKQGLLDKENEQKRMAFNKRVTHKHWVIIIK